MALDRRSDIYRNDCGDAADSGIPDIFARLVHWFKIRRAFHTAL